MEHYFPPNLGENQKKRFLPEMEHFFFPISSTDLRSDAHQTQIIGGDADEDHTQILGGIYSQIIGGDISPFPPGFGTTANRSWVIRKSLKFRTCQLENGRVKTKEHATRRERRSFQWPKFKKIMLG